MLTVQSVTPANNATINAVTDNITIAFSEAMQSSTIDNTTITLTTSNGTTVPTTVSYSNNVATINPNVPTLSSLGARGSRDGSFCLGMISIPSMSQPGSRMLQEMRWRVPIHQVLQLQHCPFQQIPEPLYSMQIGFESIGMM